MCKLAPVPALHSNYCKIIIITEETLITQETRRLIRPRARSSSNERGGAYIKPRPHAHARLSNKSQPVCRISRCTVMISARALEERNTLVFFDHVMCIFDNHM